MNKSAPSRRHRADDAPLNKAELKTAKPAQKMVPHIIDAVRRRSRVVGGSKKRLRG